MTGTLLAIGAVLVVIAVGVSLWPLIKERRTPAVGNSLWILAVIFPLAVFGIYTQVSTYPWGEPIPEPQQAAAQTSMPAVEQMVAGLAERLKSEPDDLEGWIMLGRSYMEMQKYPEAVDAWREAWRLSEGERVDVAANFAEASVMADPKSLRADAGELLDAILADNPDNAKALWYGGMAAIARGQNDIGEQRWSRLLEDPNLPPNVRQMVQQQLAAMGANVPAAQQSAPNTQAGGPELRITIEMAENLAGQVTPGQSLFVFARDAEAVGGPPVAVKRLVVGDFPMQTTLTDTDVMMPGLKLSNVKKLRIVARVSKTGNAIEAAGDLYGEVLPDALEGGTANIAVRIDSQVQ